jgi:Arc/MetJ-type ribon-helix-helix transcriptional regulator
MKVSVSLPAEEVAYLDAYAREHDMRSRSAVVHKAVALLRSSQLEAAYQEAWQSWESSGHAAVWDSASADGLDA